jgi:hypothetical protein
MCLWVGIWLEIGLSAIVPTGTELSVGAAENMLGSG